MKTTSWEIIFAGILFVVMSLYLLSHNSENPSSTQVSIDADSLSINVEGDQLKVIQLKSLENFNNLENLENLKNLRNLKNLKNLTNILPAEIQADFQTEIDEILREIEGESVRVQFDSEKGIIAIEEQVNLTKGNWTKISPGIFAYVSNFDASSLSESELILPGGSIDIKGTNNDEATLTIKASGKVNSADELNNIFYTRSEITSQKASFELSKRKQISFSPNVQFNATLSLPQNMNVNATTEGGHIKVDNVNGSQNFHTGGGHITVNKSEGSFKLNSGGGHIRLNEINGSVEMSTSGGNLLAHNFTGSVDANTKGGNIELNFLSVDGPSKAVTAAGSITIVIPEREHVQLDLSGNSVEIDNTAAFDGTITTKSAKGTFGNSGPLIFAQTNYGNITVKRVN